LDVRSISEEHLRKMRSRADPGGGERDRTGFLLGERDQFLGGLDRHFRGDDQYRCIGDHFGHGDEIAQ